MGWFGKKKEWDIQKSDANKSKLRELFNGVMEDGDSWNILYGYSEDVTNADYVLVRKTTYTFGSLIIGYRESDMSIAIVETTPELDACGEPLIYKKDAIKKTKISMGMYVIYKQGGMMAGFTSFAVEEGTDDKCLAYIYQPEEAKQFNEFFKQYGRK